MSDMPPVLPRGVAIAAAVGIGALVAFQTATNGRLAAELGGGPRAGVDAALVSFGGGFVVLCLLCLVLPRARTGLVRVARAVRAGELRPWQLAGGVCGALLVASQGVTVATIGVALFTVAVVAGATSAALLVDRAGLAPGGATPVTGVRALGAGITVAAVALAVAGRLDGSAGLALALLPLLAGAATSWQAAMNGHVALAARSPLSATWLNFCVGTAALGVMGLALLAVHGGVADLPAVDGEHWWLYTGGLYGIVFIATAALVVRVLGVLVLGLCTVAGQVVSAVALDDVWGTQPVAGVTLAGAALTLAGVAVASWRPRQVLATLGDGRADLPQAVAREDDASTR